MHGSHSFKTRAFTNKHKTCVLVSGLFVNLTAGSCQPIFNQTIASVRPLPSDKCRPSKQESLNSVTLIHSTYATIARLPDYQSTRQHILFGPHGGRSNTSTITHYAEVPKRSSTSSTFRIVLVLFVACTKKYINHQTAPAEV